MNMLCSDTAACRSAPSSWPSWHQWELASPWGEASTICRGKGQGLCSLFCQQLGTGARLFLGVGTP